MEGTLYTLFHTCVSVLRSNVSVRRRFGCFFLPSGFIAFIETRRELTECESFLFIAIAHSRCTRSVLIDGRKPSTRSNLHICRFSPPPPSAYKQRRRKRTRVFHFSSVQLCVYDATASTARKRTYNDKHLRPPVLTAKPNGKKPKNLTSTGVYGWPSYTLKIINRYTC